MLILILTLGFFFPLLAPSDGVAEIIIPEPIVSPLPPNEWLKAIVYVESGTTGSETYNKNEPQAVGKLQQYPIFVKDVNRILGYKKYSLDDRLNDKKAEEMFWIYQNYYNPEMNFEKMCRIQCGGPTGYYKKGTIGYYNLVKIRLYS